MKRRNLISGIAIVLFLALMVYSAFMLLKQGDESGIDDYESKTIIRDGVKYFPRQDIKVFLLMGIDQSGPVKDSTSYNNDGESDLVVLAVFNESERTYSILCLNRDTMLEIPVLGLGGKNAGTITGQLALSHTYGSGLKDSCENTKKTVSDFLYGLEIDYYLSLNMDAVGIITEELGGIKVNVTDDFSDVDPTITQGEVVLNSQQALTFVRTRRGVGDQMNLSRMQRHEEFMKGFLEAFGKKLDESSEFVVKTYSKISDYAVSDCSLDTLSTMISRYKDYELSEIVSPEGENKIGDEYMEFYADEKKLDTLILRLFYAKKK